MSLESTSAVPGRLPLVSVIVPAFNAETTIVRCIESICASDERDTLEVIVVDDGSGDQTSDVLANLSRLHPAVRYLHQENAGVAAARNAGLALACGQYICFVDSDDYVAPNFFSTLLHYAGMGHDLGVSEAIDVSEGGDILGGRTTSKDLAIVLDEKYDFDADYAHSTAWGCLYARNLLDGLSFLPSLTIGEDTLLYHQALLRAKRPVHISYRGYYYVQLDSSLVHEKRAARYLDESRAWNMVADQFSDKEPPARRARAMSVRHAAIGMLTCLKAHCRDAGVRELARIVVERGWSTCAQSFLEGKWRRGLLIMVSLPVAGFVTMGARGTE